MEPEKPMLTKITKSLVVIGLAVVVTACASGTRQVHVPLKDLDSFQLDCKQKDAQLDMLYRLLPGALAYQRESYNGMYSSTQSTIYVLTGQYKERQMGGFNQAVIRRKIDYLETWCP
jgi:hypothetical protein